MIEFFIHKIKLWRLIQILLLGFSIQLRAQVQSIQVDTIVDFKMYFCFDSYAIDSSYMENHISLQKLDALLNSEASHTSLPDSISITASSSPDGNALYNEKLAQNRLMSIREYIINRYPLVNQSDIKYTNLGEDWEGLRQFVASDAQVPQQQKVLDVIDSDINVATKEWRLKQIANGAAWRYMKRLYLSKLRNVASYKVYYQTSINDTVVEQPLIEEVVVKSIPEPIDMPVVDEISTPSSVHPLFAIKTNLLYDAITAFNLELELPIGKKWSISCEYIFPWMKSTKADWTMRIMAGHGAVKYWLGNRDEKSVLTGWSVGVTAGGGKYDGQFFNKTGRQGHLWDAGAQLGYAHRVGRHFTMEYILGLGYAQTDYKVYHEVEDTQYGNIKVFDYPWITKRRNWIGPISAKVSLVWLINYKSTKH